MAPPPRLAVGTGDLALGCLAEASSVKSTERIAANVVDGNSATRWTSAYKDDQWLSLDLEAAHAVSRVHIKWEKAFAKSYELEGSPDGSVWRTLAREKGQEGWVETALPLRGPEVRHLRISCKKRATEYGFSIWHVQVFGTGTSPNATGTSPTGTSHWNQPQRSSRRADCLPYAALPSVARLRMLPALLGRQLKWYAWNAVAQAARLRFAEKCAASRLRREQLAKAAEDEHRRDEHLRAVKSAGVLASATLLHLQAQLELCGAAAADAALAGRPLESLPTEAALLPPAELDEGLWRGILGSVLLACRAMTEALMDTASPGQGYEPYSHRDKSRQLQEDFESLWQLFFRGAAASAQSPTARCDGSIGGGSAHAAMGGIVSSSVSTGSSSTGAAPAGTPQLSHAGWQVLWMIWNEMWFAANLECSRSSRLSASRQRAEEDAARSSEHLAEALEAEALDGELLLDIRWHAFAAGRAAALENWGGAPAAAEATSGSARGWSPAFQGLLEEVLRLGAAAVKEMLADELDSGDDSKKSKELRMKRARALQSDFEHRWRFAFNELLESQADGHERQAAVGVAGPAASTAHPLAATESSSSSAEQCREAMWLVWNELWFGANDDYAHSPLAEAGSRVTKLDKALENLTQSEKHLQGMREDQSFPAGVLEQLRRQARAAGRAAAHCAVQGRALIGRQFEVRAPPGGMSAVTWELALDSLAAAAAAAAEMLLDDYTPPPRQTPTHKFRSRWLQAEFEHSWHSLYDPPHQEAPRARGLVPALREEQLCHLPQSAVDEYLCKGFVGPLEGLAEAEVRECHRGFQGYDYGSQSVGSPRGSFLGHALLPWLWDLACHPRLLGAVAAVLRTSTVLLYQSLLISRSPGKSGKEETGVDWHSDGGGFRNIGPLDDFVTVFLALTPSTRKSGGLEFVPQRGEGEPIVMELQAGEFSLHSASVNHRAIRNVTRQRRDCIIFRYISGRVRDLVARVQERSPRDFALLCCGQDCEGHFHPIPRPSVSEGEKEVALWQRIVKLRKQRGPLA